MNRKEEMINLRIKIEEESKEENENFNQDINELNQIINDDGV